MRVLGPQVSWATSEAGLCPAGKGQGKWLRSASGHFHFVKRIPSLKNKLTSLTDRHLGVCLSQGSPEKWNQCNICLLYL